MSDDSILGVAAPAVMQSDRLVMREWMDDDVEPMALMHSEPRLRAHLLDDYPLNQRAVARAFIASMRDFYRAHRGLGIWHTSVIHGHRAYCHGSAGFIGWFSLMPMPGHAGQIELGARLLPLAWGGGLSLEGGQCVLDHAFGSLDRASVRASCHPDNRSAVIALQALGFLPLGLGHYAGQSARLFEIRLNDWQANRHVPVGTRLRRAIAAQRNPITQTDPLIQPEPPGHEDPSDERSDICASRSGICESSVV